MAINSIMQGSYVPNSSAHRRATVPRTPGSFGTMRPADGTGSISLPRAAIEALSRSGSGARAGLLPPIRTVSQNTGVQRILERDETVFYCGEPIRTVHDAFRVLCSDNSPDIGLTPVPPFPGHAQLPIYETRSPIGGMEAPPPIDSKEARRILSQKPKSGPEPNRAVNAAFYAIRAPSGSPGAEIIPDGDICPFALQVVPASTALSRDEYYVLSVNGVAHVCRGVAVYYSTQEWYHGIHIWSVLHSMRFFRSCRLRHFFNIWAQAIRTRHLMDLRDAVADLSFQANPALGSVLRTCMRFVRQLTRFPFFPLPQETGTHAASFIDYSTTQQQASSVFDRSVETVVNTANIVLAALVRELSATPQLPDAASPSEEREAADNYARLVAMNSQLMSRMPAFVRCFAYMLRQQILDCITADFGALLAMGGLDVAQTLPRQRIIDPKAEGAPGLFDITKATELQRVLGRSATSLSALEAALLSAIDEQREVDVEPQIPYVLLSPRGVEPPAEDAGPEPLFSVLFQLRSAGAYISPFPTESVSLLSPRERPVDIVVVPTLEDINRTTDEMLQRVGSGDAWLQRLGLDAGIRGVSLRGISLNDVIPDYRPLQSLIELWRSTVEDGYAQIEAQRVRIRQFAHIVAYDNAYPQPAAAPRIVAAFVQTAASLHVHESDCDRLFYPVDSSLTCSPVQLFSFQMTELQRWRAQIVATFISQRHGVFFADARPLLRVENTIATALSAVRVACVMFARALAQESHRISLELARGQRLYPAGTGLQAHVDRLGASAELVQRTSVMGSYMHLCQGLVTLLTEWPADEGGAPPSRRVTEFMASLSGTHYRDVPFNADLGRELLGQRLGSGDQALITQMRVAALQLRQDVGDLRDAELAVIPQVQESLAAELHELEAQHDADAASATLAQVNERTARVQLIDHVLELQADSVDCPAAPELRAICERLLTFYEGCRVALIDTERVTSCADSLQHTLSDWGECLLKTALDKTDSVAAAVSRARDVLGASTLAPSHSAQSRLAALIDLAEPEIILARMLANYWGLDTSAWQGALRLLGASGLSHATPSPEDLLAEYRSYGSFSSRLGRDYAPSALDVLPDGPESVPIPDSHFAALRELQLTGVLAAVTADETELPVIAWPRRPVPISTSNQIERLHLFHLLRAGAVACCASLSAFFCACLASHARREQRRREIELVTDLAELNDDDAVLDECFSAD